MIRQLKNLNGGFVLAKKESSKCPKGKTSGDSALRFVPINDLIRNGLTDAGWGFPYGTDKSIYDLENTRYNVPHNHILKFSLTSSNYRQLTSTIPPGVQLGGKYLKKLSKKNRIRKKRKVKKN